jgi:hypothetical protein
MANSVGGVTTGDSSAADWEAGTLGAAESYAQAEADKAADARDAAAQANSTPQQVLTVDGIEYPPGGDEPGTASGTNGSHPSTGGGSSQTKPLYLTPTEAQQMRDSGFPVQVDSQGRPFIPQGDIQITQQVPQPQAPSLDNVPKPDHTSAPTTPADPLPPASTPADPLSVAPTPELEPKKPARPIVSGLGKDVDDIINKSPTLRQKWEELQKQNYKVKFTDDPKSISNTDHEKQTITINLADVHTQGCTAAEIAAKKASLWAHEVGHAATPLSTLDPATTTREEYVERGVKEGLANEGAAAFENARARDEVLGPDGKGPDIGIRGGYDPDYINIYNRYKSGEISETQAKGLMAQVMAAEPQSGTPGHWVTKEEDMRSGYQDRWDDVHKAE